MKTGSANMILDFKVVAILFVVSCAQQSLTARQIVDSTPIASKGNLPSAAMRDAAFSTDESKVVTWQKVQGGIGGWSEHCGIQVWDLASKQITSINTPEGNSDTRISTCIPVFDPTGKSLVFSDRRRSCIVIWDTSSGKEVVSLSSGENTLIQQLQFLPHANYLVAIGTNVVEPDSIFNIWNTRNWEELTPTVISNTYITVPNLNSATPFLFDNGKLLVTWKKAYEYHDLIQGSRLSAKTSIHEDFRRLDDRHAGSSDSYTFDNAVAHAHAHTQNGRNFNRFKRLDYELETGKLLGHRSIEVPGEVIGRWIDRKKAPSLRDILTHIDSLPLASDLGYGDGSILNRFTPNKLIKDGGSVLFLDGAELETRYTLKRSQEDLQSSSIPSTLVNLDVYKDFALIPRVSQGGTVACYRHDASGLHQVAMHETKSPVLELVRSRSGNLIAAVCGGDGSSSVVLIDMPALQEQAVLKIGQASIGSVAFSDDDTMVAVGVSISSNRTGSEYVINIYDTKSGEIKKSLKSRGFLPSLAFTPDSTRLIAGGAFSEHYIWNLQMEQAPEVLSIDDKETVYDPISGKLVEHRGRLRYRSEAIAFRTDEKAWSVLSFNDKLQFVDWEKGKQNSVFGFNQRMKFIRSDDNDKDIVYVETQRLPGSPGGGFGRDIDGQFMDHKYKTNDIAALDITKKQIVNRFTTTFVPTKARLFDLAPTSGLILGIEPRDGQVAPIFLANGSTGKIECSVDTSMQYVNDAICLPQRLFMVGGHTIPRNNIEIVDLKSGTTVKHLENQSLLSFGSCKGLNYLITRDSFPKTDKLHFWRLEDGNRFASVSQVGLQRVVISPSEERVASLSGDSISVWSVQQLKDGFEKK